MGVEDDHLLPANLCIGEELILVRGTNFESMWTARPGRQLKSGHFAFLCHINDRDRGSRCANFVIRLEKPEVRDIGR